MRRTGRRLAAVLALGALAASIMGGTGSASPTFDPATRIAGGRGYEPGIDIAANGDIFINEPSGLGAQSSLWRSTNGGASYDRITFPNPWRRLPGGGDSDVAIGPDSGRLYFLDLWAGSNSLIVSEDNGATWSSGTPFTSLPLSDRQWIEVGEYDPITGHDTVYVIYALIQPPRYVMLARSEDSGLTWTSHVVVPALNGAGTGFTGQVVADGAFVAVSYEEGGHLYVASSSDAGNTWTSRRVSDVATPAHPSIQGLALDKTTGALHAVWSDRNRYAIHTSTSTDDGLTWSTPLQVSVPNAAGANYTGMFPWIAARNGKVAISWYGTDALPTVKGPDDVSSAYGWYIKYVESLDGGATYSIPVNAHAGYAKKGLICTGGLSCSSGRDLGDFQQVTIDNAGKSMIVFGALNSFPYSLATVKQQ